jgi:hypothetical protein
MSMGWFDNADIDMGFAMKKNKLIGIYVEKMKVWHEETTELNYYFKKSYYRGVLAGKLAQKWKLSGQFTDIRLQNWFYYLFSIRKWFREYNNYSKICELKILSFLFIKLSERVFLKGFLTTLK